MKLKHIISIRECLQCYVKKEEEKKKKNETLNQLLLHTEVRWLSRGDSLQKLVDRITQLWSF